MGDGKYKQVNSSTLLSLLVKAHSTSVDVSPLSPPDAASTTWRVSELELFH
jgi:hypothetical protein